MNNQIRKLKVKTNILYNSKNTSFPSLLPEKKTEEEERENGGERDVGWIFFFTLTLHHIEL
jgi:hypothetical protein